MRVEEREDGQLTAVCGGSRFGKSSGVIAEIKTLAPVRALAWDAKPEYYHPLGWKLVQTIPELAKCLNESWDGEGKFAYHGPLDTFNDFAELAWKWLQLWPPVLVLEEMGDVTSSGKATGALGELIRKGLGFGAHIYAITQRPQETTKTIWGNASVVRTYGFILPLDQQYMASVTGVDPAEIANLPKYHWIERRAGDHTIYRGENPR